MSPYSCMSSSVVSVIMAPRSVVNFLAAQWRLHQTKIKQEAKANAATSDYDDKLKAMQADFDESQNFCGDKLKKMEEMVKGMAKDLMKTSVSALAGTAKAIITTSMETVSARIAKEIGERVGAVEEEVAEKLIGFQRNLEKVNEFAIQTLQIQHVTFSQRFGEDY